MSAAAQRWSDALAAWTIPASILDQAPQSPWRHETATFVVDETLDREVQSARVAREVLPAASGTVLDVGCGGGRAAMSLVPPAERVIGVDADPRMLAEFTSAAASVGARSMTIEGRWPDVAVDTPVADVVTCHHVAYNVADIEPFLMALTAHARLAVVMVLPTRHPQTAFNAAWKHFWDLDRPTSPTDDDLVAVLAELGIEVERWSMPRPPLASATADPATRVPTLRRRLCLSEDRDDEIAEYLESAEPLWASTHTVLRWPGQP
ncbi:MAG: class I SAM-dependent methyltransferase [Ilumatobacter sp.]|uniref:class I SAM-dependent methyltransferase n=1 Tax=Ilumatobacter sp. TaxID=1967498 RepID=UPI00391BE583